MSEEETKTEEAQASIDSEINDLIEAAAVAEDAPVEGKPPEDIPVQEPQTEESQPEAKPVKVKVRGREYTVEELIADGVLDDLAQTYEQFPHLQQKYTELLENAKGIQKPEAQPGQGQGEAGQRVYTQEEIRLAYWPKVEEAVENGYLSADFTEAFPDEATQLLYHRDILYQLFKAVMGLVDRGNQDQQVQQKTAVQSFMDTAFNNMASKGSYFEPLGEEAQRQAFLDYLVTEVNPPVSQITQEFLERQWLAFNHEAIQEGIRMAQQSGKKEHREAIGEGGGSIGGARPQQPNEIDELIRGF